MPAALPEDLLPDLKRLLEVAVKQSPSMIAGNLDLASKEGNRIIARSGMLPTISGNALYAYTETAVSANTSSSSKTNGPLYQIALNQPVFHWGALKAQADIGKIQLHVAEKQYAEMYRTLALSIRNQYLDLIQKKATVAAQHFSVRTTESYLSVQEARLKNGRISAGDIIGPRLALDEARIYDDRAVEDYDASKRMLARLVGVADIPDDSIPSEVPKPVYARETIGSYFEEMKKFGPGNAVLLGAMEGAVRESELNYHIAKRRLYPKFNFSASFGQSNQTQVDSVTRSPILTAITTTQVAIGAYWTIFDGLATRGAKMSALAARRLAERKLDQFRESIDESARQMEKQIGFAGRLMDLTEVRRNLAFAAVEKVGKDVKNGVSPQNSLDQVTQTANTAALAASKARADFLQKWSAYVSLLGVDPVLNNLPSRYLRNGK
jgi:outer membrane protein TolC